MVVDEFELSIVKEVVALMFIFIQNSCRRKSHATYKGKWAV